MCVCVCAARVRSVCVCVCVCRNPEKTDYQKVLSTDDVIATRKQ